MTPIDSADDFDPREAYPLIDRVMEDDDAHDPLLQSYYPRLEFDSPNCP